MAYREVSIVVNGRRMTVSVKAGRTLLQFLRDDLGLTGTKEGCGEGECGACTVLLNNRAVNSCLVPVEAADGCEIMTIEGLARDGQLDPLQEAFVNEGAVQCGFCTPGMVMSAKALVLSNPRPTDEEIREALAGNLCRCTGYQKIIHAIKVATGQADPLKVAENEDHSVIGKKVRRRDAMDKVTGQAEYTADLRLPGMLYGRVLRSEYAHARLKGIDCTAALKAPGVITVLTAKDIPGINRYGLVYSDQRVLADDKVRCTGDALALVVAETERAAEAALSMIRVEYEELPGVFSAETALEPGAPIVHEKSNLVQHTKVRKGHVESAFRQCEAVVQETFQTQCVEHAYLEPECSVASVDRHGNVTVWTSTQYVFRDRRQIAPVLGIPINRVRVIQMTTGGGFGGKDDVTTEILAALASYKTGKPVRVRFTREESMRATTKRHPMTIKCRLGADGLGRLLALEGKIYADTGAYVSLGVYVVKKAGLHLCGPYYIPNIKVDTYTVYTNNPPSGAMRGFGVVQAALAHESLMDMLAERLKMDRWEIRYKNALEPGLSTGTGHVLEHGVGIKATLARIKEYLDKHPLPVCESDGGTGGVTL